MKFAKRLMTLLTAASMLALNVGIVPYDYVQGTSMIVASAVSVDELTAGEYDVKLNFNRYESSKDRSYYNDFIIIDYAKLVVSTDESTNEKTYKLKLPIDYKPGNGWGSLTLFGYSYTKYTSSDGVKDSKIKSQAGYVNLKEGLNKDSLYKIDETTSEFCYEHEIPLNNPEDKVYIYFNYGGSYERLELTLDEIGVKSEVACVAPTITGITSTAKTSQSGGYYQDTDISPKITFDCSGNAIGGYVCELLIDDGNGYEENAYTPSNIKYDSSNGRYFTQYIIGDAKYETMSTQLSYYLIKNHDAHELKIKARVGAKYRGSDDIYWSEYYEATFDIEKAGVTTVYSNDSIADFTNNIKPRLYATDFVIPYDTKLSIEQLSDSGSLENIEQLLKDKTGRNNVDFSALNINLLDADGELLSEMTSDKSWGSYTSRTLTLPSIKDFDVNNMGIYRYVDGMLIEQGVGDYTYLAVNDADTGEQGFSFQPDTNGPNNTPSGTYVFIQKDYSDFKDSLKTVNWLYCDAHLFDVNNNLKTDNDCDSLISDNKAYSYYSNEESFIYVKLSDVSGNYMENIRYKDTASENFVDAEVIEKVSVDGKEYPSVIRIPRKNNSAYFPLKFDLSGTEKELNLGISYNSGTPMYSKPKFTAPVISVKNTDGIDSVNFINDGTAYVSLSANANNQKIVYTLTKNGTVVSDNECYTGSFELKAESEEGSVYEIQAWVETNDAVTSGVFDKSDVVSAEITFSEKGAYAETAKSPIIGIQYKHGDSLNDASFKVVITSETEGAVIYYTTDGSEPTSESSVYNGEFTVNGLTGGNATVIKAIAMKEGINDSEIAQKTVEFKTGWWDNLLPNSEYSIPVSMVKFSDPTQFSMGNGAVDGDAIFKVDANGNKTLIIPFKPLDIAGTNGYVIHYWYFADESKAYAVGWNKYMLDYECNYNFNSDGTIKSVILPVSSDEELIPAALEANVDIMGKKQVYVKPDYSSVIEDITGVKQENTSIDSPEISAVLSKYESNIKVTISMPESSDNVDAEIYYIITQDEDALWNDNSAVKYDAAKPIIITRNDVDADGLTNVYAIAKSGDKTSIISTKKLMLNNDNVPKLDGYIGELSDTVGLTFQIQMPAALVASNPTAEIVIAGKTSNVDIKFVSTNSNTGNSICKFTANLDAKQMTDIVSANIICGDETVATFTGCVKDYAETIIANADKKYSTEAIAAAKAMLNYGGYSQKLFSYNTSSLANASLDSTDVSSVTVETLDNYKPTKTGSDDTANFTGYNLYLNSLTSMRFYYTGDVKATSTATNYTTGTSGKENYVEITGITPANLVNGYDVKIGGMTVHASPASYAHTALKLSSDENLQNAMRAMILYSEAVAAYDASLNN